MGVIYKITCNINGKVYIGQTKHTANKRFKKHKKDARYLLKHGKVKKGTCVKLYNAINAHGENNFTISTLIEATIPELDALEIQFILEYDSISNGYNQKSGGNRSDHSEQTKKQISQSMSEYRSVNTDQNRKEESKGLPKRIIHIKGKNEGFAINKHPLCPRKTFTIRKFKTQEAAKKAALEHLI